MAFMNPGCCTLTVDRGSFAAAKYPGQSKFGARFVSSMKVILWLVACGSRRATFSSDATASCFSMAKMASAARREAARLAPPSSITCATWTRYFSRASWNRGSLFT